MKTTFIAAGLLALASVATHAGTVTYTDSYPGAAPAVQTTNWSATLSLPQFDAGMGTLTGVQFSASSRVQGAASAENLDAAAATVVLTLAADITVDMSSVGVADFLFNSVGDSSTNALSGFDGAIDFAGTSGVGGLSGISLSGTASDSLSTGAAAVFIGGGLLAFDAVADGASVATGAGGLIAQFATQAGVDLTVTYTFDEPVTQVPVPAPLGLLGLGLLALTAKRRRAA